MAKTLAERRRYDRERKRRQRAARKAAGMPPLTKVNAALAEGLVFAMRQADRTAWVEHRQPVDLGDIVRCAQRILIKRHGFDAAHVKAALQNAARPRQEHTWPSYTKSMTGSDDGRPAH